jgi:hypothetical protein
MAVGRRVHTDPGVIGGKLGRKESPHQSHRWKAVNYENPATLLIDSDKRFVPGDIDLRGVI